MGFKKYKENLVEKINGMWTHFFILVYNKIWVKWVSGIWDLLTIYDKIKCYDYWGIDWNGKEWQLSGDKRSIMQGIISRNQFD